MDVPAHKHAYRCLPMVVANTSGWELITPSPFTATWNGGSRPSDIKIESPSDAAPDAHSYFAQSHFGAGVLTFRPGYLFRTEPGWDVLVTGPPNHVKHGIQPLTGVVETSWLAFPFTINWRFTAPGAVSFDAGEPFGFITLLSHTAIDSTQPVIKSLADDPELHARAVAARDSRNDYAQGRTQGRGGAARGWQQHYFRGEHASGEQGSEDHVHRRRLKAPRPAGAEE